MNKPNPLDLTIVIPVKNEEQLISGCLEALGQDFAKNVILVDSNSSDATTTIAAEWGAEVIDFSWDGRFPKKRNWFLREHSPDTTWVMFLDADEYLTDEFKAELRKELQHSEKVGYWLHYSIYFLGKRLRYGYPLDKLALFRVGAGEYEKIDEDQWSNLDMEIHEHPVLEGEIGTISAKIDHRDFREITSYVSKHNEYSSWEAARFLKMKNEINRKRLTWKQKIKYSLIYSPIGCIAYFCGAYFLMGGILDGTRGLTFAVLKAGYFAQVYAKIVEQNAKHDSRTIK